MSSKVMNCRIVGKYCLKSFGMRKTKKISRPLSALGVEVIGTEKTQNGILHLESFNVTLG